MKKRLFFSALAVVISLAALMYLYMTKEGEGAGIPCLFYQMTGFYCAGCGASRALRSLIHLDFLQAFRYNALFTVSFPIIAAYFCFLGISYILYGKDKISCKIPFVLLIVLGITSVLFAVIRNIPSFSFLAPTMIR